MSSGIGWKWYARLAAGNGPVASLDVGPEMPPDLCSEAASIAVETVLAAGSP